MAAAATSFIFSKAISNAQKHHSFSHHLPRSSVRSGAPRHAYAPPQALASSSTAASFPINADYLAQEFGGHGVSFEAVGDDECALKLALANGSAAHLLLPSGLVTSYKPLMWHGAATELLHTSVSERGRDVGGAGGGVGVVIRGGVSTELCCRSGGDGDEGEKTMLWSPRSWVLRDIRGCAEEFIQVELISVQPKTAEAKLVISLHPELLMSEFAVTNTGLSSLSVSGSVISHIHVSTPVATYAVGLEGSSYRSGKPWTSEFDIVPPDFADEEDDEEGEEEHNNLHLESRMSRIYSSAPRELTIVDRGKRNSIVHGRIGFDELYLQSPGSKHDFYGNYSYISIGAIMLTPMNLRLGDTWEGEQYLYNPNL